MKTQLSNNNVRDLSSIEILLPEDAQFEESELEPTFTQRVCDAAVVVFNFIKNIITIPFRSIGSKTWSLPGLIFRLPIVIFMRIFGSDTKETFEEQLFGKGYHFGLQNLTPDQTLPYLRDACIASSVAKCDKTWFEPYDLKLISPQAMQVDLSNVSGNIEIDDNRFLDRDSGLKMIVVANETEAVIAFGAAEAAKNDFPNADENPEWEKLRKKIWKNAVWNNLLGMSSPLYRQAEELFLAIRDNPALRGKEIKIVGHCLGGSLGAYIGLKHQVSVNGFNTLPLGLAQQNEIGGDRLKEADQYITHVSVSNDFLSDCHYLSVIDRIVNFLGFKTPGNFGKHFRILPDPSYNSQHSIHNFYVGSALSFMGYPNRWKPIQLTNHLKKSGINSAFLNSADLSSS